MKVHSTLAMLGASVALGAAPALALAAPPSHPSGPPSGLSTGVPAAVASGSGTPSASALPSNQGTAHKPQSQRASHASSTPGPAASLPAKAKAYGQFCQVQSKRHVAGQNGTPFSKCVTSMARLANGQVKSPRAACQGESKTHVAGQPGTPFSLCVAGAAKLLADTGRRQSALVSGH